MIITICLILIILSSLIYIYIYIYAQEFIVLPLIELLGRYDHQRKLYIFIRGIFKFVWESVA